MTGRRKLLGSLRRGTMFTRRSCKLLNRPRRSPVAAKPVAAQPVALAQAITPLLMVMSDNVQGSPYVAVVQDLSVEVSRTDKSEETHRFKARVLETIRGPKLSEISYVIITEPGETSSVHTKSRSSSRCVAMRRATIARRRLDLSEQCRDARRCARGRQTSPARAADIFELSVSSREGRGALGSVEYARFNWHTCACPSGCSAARVRCR